MTRRDFLPSSADRAILRRGRLRSPNAELAAATRRLNAVVARDGLVLGVDWSASWDELMRQLDAAADDFARLDCIEYFEAHWSRRFKEVASR